MAWVFVKLKARLIANGLYGGARRVVGFVVAIIYGLGLAITGFAVLAVAGSRRSDGGVIVVLFGAALTIGWAILPLLGFGSDETLDPTRLELLPLGRRDLMTGLLAASLVGVGPFATMIAMAGAVVGFSPLGPGAVLVVVAALLQVLVCITASRAIVTALSAMLRSRKGRDLRVIFVALVALSPELLRFVFVPANSSIKSLQPLANVVGWTPLAIPMRALVAASQGRILVAVGELALGALCVVVLGWWWSRSLERIATTAEPVATRAAKASSAGATAAAAQHVDALFGSLLAWLPRTRTGAVAAREIRVSWRDPRRRVQLVSTVLFPFLVLAGILAQGVAHRPALVYAALLAIALGGARVNNQLGMDGRAWWVHEASGADWARDILGKNISVAVTSLPLVAITAVILAALGDGWSQLLPVLLLAVSLCAVQLAIGNVTSIRAPWAVPASRSNAFATNTGQGCFAGLVGLLALVALGVLSLPGVVAILSISSTTGRTLVGVVSLAYGYGLWRLGTRIAVRDANRRGPELLARLSEGAGAR